MANTGQNITNTRQLLQRNNIHAKTAIVVQKPYMERRAYAAFRKQWPELEITVTSPQLSFAAYPTKTIFGDKQITRDFVINVMLGDLQRIREYPSKGFQIPQQVPGDVW